MQALEKKVRDPEGSSPGFGESPATGQPPLVVDLDGTLVRTDLLTESFFILLKQNPLYLFRCILWLFKGRANLKARVAERVTLDVNTLPYNEGLLRYLRRQHAEGRRLVVATAADQRLACQIADHLQLFETVLASDGTINLSGKRKRTLLSQEFGEKGFDYAGNAQRDLAVWSAARRAIVVTAKPSVQRRVSEMTPVERVFEHRKTDFTVYWHALRLHQWLKNLLVFVPLIAANRLSNTSLLAQAAVAFLAFGISASSVYLMNDLLDLSADRRHPRKRLRPLAAGELAPNTALWLIPALMGSSVILSLFLPLSFLGILVVYYGLTLAYSFYLKHIALLDVIVLASLYGLRILAGSWALGIWPSSWLLVFSTFLFLSLALVKRYGELVTMRDLGGGTAKARGYLVSDRDLLASLGSASGYVSVLVLLLYITHDSARILYEDPELIFMVCPFLLYWISHIWLAAHRGRMDDDPLVFAFRDRTSLVLILCATVIMILAA